MAVTARPSVSVLMPVYNVAPFVSDAIESILQQTYSDFEFLIIDDGSSDGSGEIVARYAEQDARIRFTQRENRGVSATLNELAAQARAPYLARMDSDDIALPDRFGKQVAYLDAHADIDVLGGYAMVIDEENRPIFTMTMVTESDQIDHWNLTKANAIAQNTVMMRSATFHSVNGYDEYFRNAEDLDLWLRLGEVGRIANIPEILVKYRLHDASLSRAGHQQQMEMALEARRRAHVRRGLGAEPRQEESSQLTQTTTSIKDEYLNRAWQAWKHGHRDTAHHYFRRAVLSDPLSLAAWKGVILGTIKRSPTD